MKMKQQPWMVAKIKPKRTSHNVNDAMSKWGGDFSVQEYATLFQALHQYVWHTNHYASMLTIRPTKIVYLNWVKSQLDVSSFLGGSRGRRRGPPPSNPLPPTRPNSFIFAYIFTKKCPHQRLAPQRGRKPPSQHEILDQPLSPVVCQIWQKTSIGNMSNIAACILIILCICHTLYSSIWLLNNRLFELSPDTLYICCTGKNQCCVKAERGCLFIKDIGRLQLMCIWVWKMCLSLCEHFPWSACFFRRMHTKCAQNFGLILRKIYNKWLHSTMRTKYMQNFHLHSTKNIQWDTP